VRIGIIGNTRKELFFKLLPELLTWFSRKNVEILLPEKLSAFLEEGNYPKKLFVDPKGFCEKPDLFLAFGGDGTILHMVNLLCGKNRPILGINLGRLGFLTEVQVSDLYPALDMVIQGKYKIDKRMMLKANINGEKEEYSVLNDVVVNKKSDARLIRITIYLDDVFFNRFIADGVIISTPTGSTAYNLSAGGPVILPNTEAMVISPICPHSLSIRSVLVSSSCNITIFVESDLDEFSVSFDGQPRTVHQTGTSIKIHRSEYLFELIRLTDYDFAKTLRTKLLWSEDLRDRQKFDV
jgi:NAD+ kinase